MEERNNKKRKKDFIWHVAFRLFDNFSDECQENIFKTLVT